MALIKQHQEQDLLKACIKAFFDSEYEKDVELLLDPTLNWQEVIVSASHHRILPLVCRILLPAFEEKIPSQIVIQIKEYQKKVSLFSMALNVSLLRVVSLLSENEIKVLSVKGGLLAERLYGSPLMRNYADVDILIPSNQLDCAVELMMLHGYTLQPEGIDKKTFLRFLEHYHHCKMLDVNGGLIELHVEISAYYASIPITFSEIEQSLVSSEFQGIKILDLNDEMLFIYLCLHSSKHNWDKLDYLCSIYALVNKNQLLSWDIVLKLALKYRMVKRVLIAIKLTEEMFECEIPGIFQGYIKMFSDIRKITEKILKNEWACDDNEQKLKFILHQACMMDRKIDAVRFIIRSFIVPEPEKWRSNSYMNNYFFLYFLYKPFHAVTLPLRKLFS